VKGVQAPLTGIIGTYLAIVLQQALAPRLSLFGIAPDFGLVFVVVFGLLASRISGTVVGFAVGAMEGAIAGVNLTHYVISRVLAGFCAGSTASFGLQPNAAVAAAATAVITGAAQILLFFLAPPSGIGRFLGDTIGAAMYNGVLAIPVYALLRRILAAPGI
jgi:rod shape-determining protein MreD